jgi:hypothetical protein
MNNCTVINFLLAPVVVPINPGAIASGSGPRWYQWTSTSAVPFTATATFASQSGSLYVNNGFLASDSCSEMSCSGPTCTITNFCSVAAGTWYFYVETSLGFTLLINTPASTTTALTNTPVSGSITATNPWAFYTATSTGTGNAFLDLVITGVSGGDVTVYINTGNVGENYCSISNFTVTQAQASYNYTFTPCQLAQASTYYISVSGTSSGCSPVKYYIAAAQRTGFVPSSIDATSGYKGTLNTPIQYYQLLNVNPSGGQYVHAEINSIVGGSLTLQIYAKTVGGGCSLASCTSASSCFLQISNASSTTYFAVISGSTSCVGTTYTLTVKAASFVPLTSSPQSFSVSGYDAVYTTVSTTDSFVVVGHVTSGMPVTLTLYQDLALTQLWNQVTCTYTADCRISIPTQAAHSGLSNWYVVATSDAASSFTLLATTGTSNCGVPSLMPGAFCTGIATYNAWNYENATLRVSLLSQCCH